MLNFLLVLSLGLDHLSWQYKWKIIQSQILLGSPNFESMNNKVMNIYHKHAYICPFVDLTKTIFL
jgi:hypothetical protein